MKVVIVIVVGVFISVGQSYDEISTTVSSRANDWKTAIYIPMKNRELQSGDVVILKGQFRKRLSQVLFINLPTDCFGVAKKKIIPLRIRFYSTSRTIQITYSRQAERNVHQLENFSKHVHFIRPKNNYQLQIKVENDCYKIYLNKKFVAYLNDTVGFTRLTSLRSYGGYFKEFYIEKNTSPQTVACGLRPGFHRGNFRIVGGQEAEPGEFPWQASIRFKFSSSVFKYGFICGGSLIDSCWVITAAHCMKWFHKFFITVRLGTIRNDNKRVIANEDRQDFDVDEVFLHPDFSSSTLRHDIALVRLQTNNTECARFSDFVQPICLPNPGEEFPEYTSCSTAGWGGLSANSISPTLQLQKTNLDILSHNDCKSKYKKWRSRRRIFNESLCATGNGLTDTCFGDSGGPLSCRRDCNENGRFVLTGITSWGKNCSHTDFPGVYTKVVDHLKWIKQTIAYNRYKTIY